MTFLTKLTPLTFQGSPDSSLDSGVVRGVVSGGGSTEEELGVWEGGVGSFWLEQRVEQDQELG